MSSGPRDLLGLYVEVYDASGGSHLMGKGRVIAYADQPTITVEDDDGTRTHHVVSLPRVEYRPVLIGRIGDEIKQQLRPGCGHFPSVCPGRETPHDQCCSRCHERGPDAHASRKAL